MAISKFRMARSLHSLCEILPCVFFAFRLYLQFWRPHFYACSSLHRFQWIVAMRSINRICWNRYNRIFSKLNRFPLYFIYSDKTNRICALLSALILNKIKRLNILIFITNRLPLLWTSHNTTKFPNRQPGLTQPRLPSTDLTGSIG